MYCELEKPGTWIDELIRYGKWKKIIEKAKQFLKLLIKIQILV